MVVAPLSRLDFLYCLAGTGGQLRGETAPIDFGSLLEGSRSLHVVDEYAVLREVGISARREIEAARPPLTRSKFRDTDFDSSFARLKVLGGVDPAHPLPARHRRNVLPHLGDIGRVRQSGLEILGHVRLWPVFRWFDLNRHSLAFTSGESLLQVLV